MNSTPILSFLPSLGDIIATLFVIFLAYSAFWTRVYYKRYLHAASVPWVLLEIRVPKEIRRSPEAMELILMNSMWQTGGVGNFYKKYFQGRILAWFSLEIVSLEGQIHFYIRTPAYHRDIITSQIYAQYPQAQVVEAEDYTKLIPPFHPEGDYRMYSGDFRLTQPSHLPIKTYRDLGTDKKLETLEPDQQIDPLVNMLEAMGTTVRKNEYFWIQIIIQPEKDDSWREGGKKAINKILDRDDPSHQSNDTATNVWKKFRTITKGEQEIIEKIERKISQHAWKVGIRVIYIAKKSNYDGNKHRNIKHLFESFNSWNLNTLKRVAMTGFDNPWQDVNDTITDRQRRYQFEEYVLRMYHDHFYSFSWYDIYHRFFTAPVQRHIVNVMTADEIATIFHLPGRVLQSPSVGRIQSRKAEPPANLPM